MHCSGMAWHPEVATQLVLSSEDDRLPVIQIWDLRFATSPLSQLEGHTRWGPACSVVFSRISVFKRQTSGRLDLGQLWFFARPALFHRWIWLRVEMRTSISELKQHFCCFLGDRVGEWTGCEIWLISFWSILGEFSPSLGARLTLNCCWVAPKTTGSCAGTQVWGRYITTAISTHGLLYTELCAMLCMCPFSISLSSVNVISSSMYSAFFCLEWMRLKTTETGRDFLWYIYVQKS